MYNSTKVAERIKETAKEKGITIRKVLQIAGLGTNTMVAYKTSMPKADNLAKIADVLNCSVDYLLGRKINNEYNFDENKILNEFNSFNELGRERILQYINDIKFSPNYKKPEH